MAQTIASYDGTPIEGTVSRSSSVFAAFDWERLVLSPIGAPIMGKARASANGRLDDFPEEDRKSLTDKLGHYSDVQSINSEDTVTWGVFGTAKQEGWIVDMLAEVFGQAERPKSWELKFWARIRHPETGQVLNGPESDVVIESGGWRYVVEAKWKSDISTHKNGQSQIDMRAYQACQGLPRDRWGVIVLTPRLERYQAARDDKSVFRRYFSPEGDTYVPLPCAKEMNARALTWERLLEIIGERGRPNLPAYMDWRLSHIAS